MKYPGHLFADEVILQPAAEWDVAVDGWLFLHLKAGKACWMDARTPCLLNAGDTLVVPPRCKGIVRASLVTPATVIYFRLCLDLLTGFLTLPERVQSEQSGKTRRNRVRIGRTTSTLGRGWNARDEAAPNVINSIITDFHTGLLLDPDGMSHFTNSPPEANALNNIWGVATATATDNGSFLFSDASRSNTVENPLLGGVSYTNNLGLNPRPQAGSPALGNVLAGAPTPVNYRGAFGTNDNWADSWTALATLGILDEAEPPPPVCSQPTLTIARNGSNVDISFQSQIGCDYQLHSTDALSAGPGSWGDEGTPVSGTGSTITATRPVSGLRFFRVVTQ